MKVEVYSDVACPWCYIGKARFESALAGFADGGDEVEVVFRPFQLDPAAPAEARPLREYLSRRFGAGAAGITGPVEQGARSEGLPIDLDTALAANTLSAHVLLDLAEREHGAAVQREVAEALFRAHLAEGRDIGDPEVLAALAADAGLDAGRVREHLASAPARESVRERIDHARELGISAVPTFVFEGRYAVQGAQPASTFLQVLEAVRQEAGDAAGAMEDEDQSCADGACSV